MGPCCTPKPKVLGGKRYKANQWSAVSLMLTQGSGQSSCLKGCSKTRLTFMEKVILTLEADPFFSLKLWIKGAAGGSRLVLGVSTDCLAVGELVSHTFLLIFRALRQKQSVHVMCAHVRWLLLYYYEETCEETCTQSWNHPYVVKDVR